MDFQGINVLIRNMFKRLFIENPSINSNQVCAVTLGENVSPQFKKFLDGTDFGHKPLSKLATNLDAEMWVMIIHKNDPMYQEMKEQFEEYNTVFTEETYKKIVEYHSKNASERQTTVRQGPTVKNLLSQTVQDILSDVFMDIPDES